MRRQEPEVLLRTGLPAKTAGRNCQEVPPPGGTPGCRATAVGDAGWLSVPWGKPSVAPTSCPGNFLSRPPSFSPPLLASGNPCPWQYVHLSGSQDRLAPTSLKAGIHPKRSDLAAGVASTLTDRTSLAMGTYTYTYTSRPRALPCQRRRYRDHLMQLNCPMRHLSKGYRCAVLKGHMHPHLFDFDLEVKPMLEVLVGKTIEQSLLEVMEEEELANLRASQYAYEELRNVELAEVQRLAEQEKRHREEKERRKRQQWEVVYKHGETAQKVAARVFAQRYLADLLPSVFDSLRDGGYFYDPIERDIEIGFLPWLMNEVDKTMEYSMVGRTVLDMLIREVVEKRQAAYEQRDDQPPARKPKDELGGSGRTTEPPVGYELQEQSTAQPQRPLLGRDSLQRTPDDGRYMESVLAQETKLMEEGEYEQTKIRKTSGTEVLQPRADFQP
uniref:Radial spoke head 3 n=1 Tax=Panthera leo TaxID=9689 RepID=A0A8C8WKE1_PANLE